MRTRDEINSKVNQIIDQLYKSTRLSTSEKATTQSLLKEFKEAITVENEKCLKEIEMLNSTELFTHIEATSDNVLPFRPRNSFLE